VEQRLARWAHNPKVEGSNPSPATNQVIDKREDTLRRGIEQWLARRAHNPEVAGSNPVPATHGGVAQSVEQRTHKPRVTGSNPVAATQAHRGRSFPLQYLL
jgi:hypothetical protein